MICKNCRPNIGPSNVYHFLKEQDGGYENISYTQKDLQNYHRGLKALIKDVCAHMFIAILKKKKEVGIGFFFEYQVDEQNQLKNVFWLDSLSKRSYALLGDILSFDMTHKTNSYSVVFVPFTGLNHHRQLICFGVGLLRDEKRVISQAI